MTCPSTHELSRAISDGAPPAHLASCDACARAWAATRDMIALAREAEPALPPRARRDEVRTMLLAAGRSADVLAPRRRSRATYVIAGALAVAAAIAVFVLRERAVPAAHYNATIHAIANAQFTQAQGTPDELVHLRDGSIDVEVAPLHAGERFRVVLEDAEIEVHGTRFVATAARGKLVRVDVSHGIVEVRARGANAVLLRIGESWSAPVAKPMVTATVPLAQQGGAVTIIDEPPPSPPQPPPAKRKRAVVVKPPAVQSPPPAVPTDLPQARIERLPQERAYDDGWTAMRGGKFAEAATAFARVQLLDPDGALAEDATYWYAVALARAKAASAVTAFRDFLDHYPKSRRAGEASTMLGWLLVTARQPAEAERRFRAAANDPNRSVRDSARAGLDAVRAKP